MRRNVWTVEELRAILAALALVAQALPADHRAGFAQALGSVAVAVGIDGITQGERKSTAIELV